MLPLLRTKITVPPTRPRQIARPRLLERMRAGAQRALTLIVAPAGFGKTTLAAEWAQTRSMPVAWISLQANDHSRERFLSYLIQSLQAIKPQLGQTSLALMQGGTPEGVLFALVNDLAEVEDDFALILDDYHSVDSPQTAEILAFLLEQRPAIFHLVLTTRTIPSLNLSRLRALDQVTEITTADLRFTESEIRLFLETSMDPSALRLPAEALARLNQSTEGWAVGLQLAALALARQPEAWQALAGQEHIFDYLADEVLRRESPEVQEFLKVTALFDRFCAPLCEYLLDALPPGDKSPGYSHEAAAGGWPASAGIVNVAQTARPPARTPGRCELVEGVTSGRDQAKELIAHIERANLFLVPLDSAWYRYHALFTDFLRKETSPERSALFYRAASDWFEQNGLLDDAIHYATHAADYERAASLLESHYIDMLQRGEQTALAEWIASMPPELLESHPRLWLAQGWVSVIGLDSARALDCATKAEALIPAGKTGDQLRGEAKSLRILSGIFAGQVAAADEISEAFILLAEQDHLLHSLLHFNLGLHHIMRGETSGAVEALSETLRLTSVFKLPLVTIIAHTMLGETRQMRGALGLAERNFQQVIRYAKETLGEHTSLLGMPCISYAELLREQNRFEEAVRYAEQGIDHCHIWQPVASMDGHITLSRLLAAQKHWDEALAHLESAMGEAETSVSVLDDTFIAIQLARLALMRSDLPGALQIIRQYDLEKASQGAYYHLSEMTQLLLCRAKVAGLASDPSAATPLIEALSTLIAESERRERVTSVIEALILRAYVLHAAGRHTDAAESLTHALSLGAQSGYVRILADEGKQLLHLLEQYRSQIHAPRSYFDQILGILRRENAPPPIQPFDSAQGRPSTLNPSTQLRAGLQPELPLTRRELDILALLAAGKSNQEIAAERVLTLNTVKKHVANILSKLGVANRTQAVMLARKSSWVE